MKIKEIEIDKEKGYTFEPFISKRSSAMKRDINDLYGWASEQETKLEKVRSTSEDAHRVSLSSSCTQKHSCPGTDQILKKNK